jgi:hypothetical protein
MQQAIEIHQQLQAELTNINAKPEPYLLHILSSSYQLLADLLSYQGKIAEAQAVSSVGEQALSQAIEQDPKNSRWQRNKHFLNYQQFRINAVSSAELIERNLTLLTDALNAQKTLLSHADHEDLMAKFWLTAAEQLQAISQFTLSKKYADLAYASFTELAAQYAQNPMYSAALSDSQLLQAKALMAEDNANEAINLCRQAQDRLTVITEKNKEPRYLITYAKALDCQGELKMHSDLIAMLKQNGIVNYHF